MNRNRRLLASLCLQELGYLISTLQDAHYHSGRLPNLEERGVLYDKVTEEIAFCSRPKGLDTASPELIHAVAIDWAYVILDDFATQVLIETPRQEILDKIMVQSLDRAMFRADSNGYVL